MKVGEIAKLLEGKILYNPEQSDQEVYYAFASDLMSDVLTVDTDKLLLITGLANVQTVRTAEVADILVIVIARGKRATREMINLAKENDIILIETTFSVFKTAGLLYSVGLKPLY
jgi:hypothetical protein